jgi:hypothetical protein
VGTLRRPDPTRRSNDNKKRDRMSTRHRITSIVVAIGLAASASPVLAQQADVTANGSRFPAGSPSVSNQTTAPTGPPPIVRISSPGGFDWVDAGIGAAGGFALSMIGLGGALAASERRRRRTHSAGSSQLNCTGGLDPSVPPSGKGVQMPTRPR